MTVDLVAIAAAVDAAVSDGTRAEWARSRHRYPTRFARRRVFRACGREYGYLVSTAGVPRQPSSASGDSDSTDDAGGAGATDHRGTADDLRSAFRDLGSGDDLPVFVRVSRAFLAGDLPLPCRPGQIVVETSGTLECDAVVRDGLLRLKALGCRVSLGDFTGRPDQRRLLPFADFVTIDARDLDVEGRPLLDLASSRGAELVATFVDTRPVLRECRAAGFALMQGWALEGRTGGLTQARFPVPRH